MARKGIIMAGGKGTRIAPLTSAVNKHLLPVYNKPMIFYPLSTLIQAGIRDVVMVCNPEDIPVYQRLLSDGSQWGMSIQYVEQPQAGGIAQGFLVAKNFLEGQPSMMVLGDNVFYGASLRKMFSEADSHQVGGTIFAYYVQDPERYGVVKFDQHKAVQEIIEKPEVPPSNFAVTGIYFYDGTAVSRAQTLQPSGRGELEITDLNNDYLAQKQLSVVTMNSGIAWLDTGTFQSMQRASNFIEAVENRQGILVGSPEVEALRSGFIGENDVREVIKTYSSSNLYRQALERVLEQGVFEDV